MTPPLGRSTTGWIRRYSRRRLNRTSSLSSLLWTGRARWYAGSEGIGQRQASPMLYRCPSQGRWELSQVTGFRRIGTRSFKHRGRLREPCLQASRLGALRQLAATALLERRGDLGISPSSFSSSAQPVLPLIDRKEHPCYQRLCHACLESSRSKPNKQSRRLSSSSRRRHSSLGLRLSGRSKLSKPTFLLSPRPKAAASASP